MRRSILLLFGTLATLVAIAALGVSMVSATELSGTGKHLGPPAKIKWSQRVVTETMTAGSTMTASVTFTSTKDIATPVLSIRPKHSTFLQVSDFPTTIIANTPYTITLTMTVPTDTARKAFNAAIFVKNRHTLAWPLKVRVKVPVTSTAALN
ncbi:MAG: hypothetical protein M1305_06645 [Candidatus Marsarchaeota archaeon]|nr:hypothetical protein [Candidatus Marsarchaeota archaeon]